MTAITPRTARDVHALELKYAESVLTALQKIEKSLREKLMQLIALEARRIELEITSLEQIAEQEAEFHAVAEKAKALEDKCKALPNANPPLRPIKRDISTILSRDLGSYFTYCKDHSHKGIGDCSYHRNWARTTMDALPLPAGCGHFPTHFGEIR